MAEVLAIDAKTLGQMLSVGERTIRRWNAAGKLPCAVRLAGSSVRWRLDEIKEWLDAGAPPREEWAALHRAQGGGERR